MVERWRIDRLIPYAKNARNPHGCPDCGAEGWSEAQKRAYVQLAITGSGCVRLFDDRRFIIGFQELGLG
jgi:hypothetical protein